MVKREGTRRRGRRKEMKMQGRRDWCAMLAPTVARWWRDWYAMLASNEEEDEEEEKEDWDDEELIKLIK